MVVQVDIYDSRRIIGSQHCAIYSMETQDQVAICREYFTAFSELENALRSGATGEQLEEIQGRVNMAHDRAKEALKV